MPLSVSPSPSRVTAEGFEASCTLCGVTASAPVHHGEARFSLVLPEPELWWPAGHGRQVLHDLAVTLGPERATRRIGLRQIELVTTPEPDGGLGFKFRVNGRDIFCRGANWIPADALPGSRINTDAVRDLMQSAVDANMNMLRVWGGGRYEPDWFYDLADEMGLLVWQDFMFACHIYPAGDAFLDASRRRGAPERAAAAPPCLPRALVRRQRAASAR